MQHDLKKPPPQEGRIPVTGGKVWYRIVGANSPGTPLLILHGGPGAPHDYLEPLEALAADRPKDSFLDHYFHGPKHRSKGHNYQSPGVLSH